MRALGLLAHGPLARLPAGDLVAVGDDRRARRSAVDRDVQAGAERLELIDGRGAIDVRRHQQRLAALPDGAAQRMVFDFSFPLNAVEGSHYLNPETGGVLLDRAVYGYGPALRFLGPVASQDVFVSRDATGLDRSADLRLQHESGAASVLTLSFDQLGANRLDLATTEGFASLIPSLGAEALHWKPHFVASPPGPAKGGVKGRLKAMPLMRRLSRHAQQQKWAFHSYGASIYAPMLAEFRDALAKGRAESGLVPLSLSRDIAALTDDARRRN